MQLVEQFYAFGKTVEDNEETICVLKKLDENSPSNKIQQKRNLTEENSAARLEMSSFKKEFWALFERLLGTNFVSNR